MMKQRSFKRQVRARMEKSTESYSAAPRQLLARSGSTKDQGSRPAEPPAPHVDSGVASMRKSDASVLSNTGRSWAEWFSLLDQWGGAQHKHRHIAKWLVEEHGVPGWWAQSITVSYEQERGLRAPGQESDGSYSVSASKTVAVEVERLFEAFDDPQLRERWLPGCKLEATTSTAPKSFRAKWGDDGSRVVAGFVSKGKGKSQVQIQHAKLRSPEAARQMKAFWADRVKELKGVMES